MYITATCTESGKGEALKTGFRYISRHYGAAHYVVTADSDGQHAAEDVYRIAEEAKRHPNDLLLGVRDFSEGDIPPKSLFGNRMTSFIFALLYGKKLSDTQTGLRAFGTGLLAFMLDVRGKRFEYELQMLISCIQSALQFIRYPFRSSMKMAMRVPISKRFRIVPGNGCSVLEFLSFYIIFGSKLCC